MVTRHSFMRRARFIAGVALIIPIVVLAISVGRIGNDEPAHVGVRRPPTVTRKVAVAITDIATDERLSKENTRLVEWPEDKIPQGSIASFEDLDGHVAQLRLVKGEPILRRKLSQGERPSRSRHE